MTNCSSSAKITLKCESEYYEIVAGGFASTMPGGVLKKCSNSGNITLSGCCGSMSNYTAAGLVGNLAEKFVSCKNSGNITIKVESSGKNPKAVCASGICNDANNVTACGNTGKIKVTSAGATPTLLCAAGIAVDGNVASKCYNKGAITLSGNMNNAYIPGSDGGYMGGVCAYSSKVTQCYNTGKISATVKAGSAQVGGVCGTIFGMKNCYNAGKVSLKGGGNVGGVAGVADISDGTVTSNYNVGVVTGKGKANKGSIFGTYSGADLRMKRNIYDNYYTGSGKPYGTSGITWKEWVAKATKVSSITKGNCPKLSSKYWTYSSKVKRMILKNNKE